MKKEAVSYTHLDVYKRQELVRFHASSGTTGKPTVVGYTRKDLDVWLNNVALSLIHI